MSERLSPDDKICWNLVDKVKQQSAELITLRAERDRLRVEVDRAHHETSAAEAERDRLKEALEKIASGLDADGCVWDYPSDFRDFARAAIAAKEPTP